MKMYILLLVCLIPFAVASQTLSGYVYSAADDQPLEAATVYIDGTTIAATTDARGFFTLHTGQMRSGILVVSYIGLETLRVENPFQYDKALKLMLKEDSIMMDVVEITGNTVFTRKQMLRVFREQFLGKTKSGTSCRIENEDDITLWYDTETNTLHASAKKPLIIHNKRLQYDVLFDLISFEVSFYKKSLEPLYLNRSFFAGTTYFKDLAANGSADKRRGEAYKGSVPHLLRTMVNNTWEEENFRLYTGSFPADHADYFVVTDTLGVKKITVTEPAEKAGADLNKVNYIGKAPKKEKKMRFQILYNLKDQSFIEFSTGLLYVDGFGQYTPIEEITFGGYLSGLKAGDMLPSDYKYKP